MSNYSGVVRRVYHNQVGRSLLHSFQLDSDKTYYNMGEVPPTFSEGVTVEFDGTPAKRQGNVDVRPETIRLVSEAKVDYSMKNQPPVTGARKTQLLQKDDYWNRKEDRDIENSKRIEIQACRNTAIAFIQAAGLQADPDEGGFLGLVDKYTTLFLENNNARLTK